MIGSQKSLFTNLLLIVMVMVLVAVLFTPVKSKADVSGVCPATLRFADTGIEGLEELRRAFGQFIDTMEKVLKVEVQFFPVGHRTAAVNALRFEQVDIVMAGPSEYVAIESRIPGNKPIISISRPSYASIFIAPENSGINSLQDLRGKRVAMKDVGSTTGHIIPSYMLIQEGFNLDRDVTILNIDGARFEALIAGDVHAVGTGVRDWEPFINRAGGGFKIIAQSDPMPDDVILAGPHISKECVAGLKDAMMSNADTLLEAILAPGERDKYIGATMVEVSDEDYNVVRDAYSALGITN
ncbi:phosphate/phosphite/phosphonate ABC transporter substrate-binding protein [Desulfonatronovibrio magnus]|uniref:phosphate/phosphite/phosphonate ABC transporter substrate-binding protein n=1 Tax=Desulfonatronovibrio magnus TaxID=698827 RepID=UPI00069796DB|nr:phosphate/phosphite/phosphonate ABC transporter substrate-binding protein [Desulfonatronovibrio magnus]